MTSTPTTHALPLSRRRGLVLGAFGLALGLGTGQVAAQTFPNKPLRLLVGYSAGGAVDAMARLLAQGLSAELGQQVVVDNRAGASGLIAAEAVSRSAADGYTLLLGESGLLIASHLQPGQRLDPLKSFAPVAGLFTTPLMIVANNDFPARNPKELVAALKARPGLYSYATSGLGTVHHLGFEMLKGQSNTFVVHIPYRGAAQIVPDVMSGQVPLGVVSATAGITQSKAGRLRALAMMSPVKLAGAEDVAPLSDALPGFNVAPRLVLLAPLGTPANIVDTLNTAVRNVLAKPETTRAANAQGAVPAYLSSSDLGPDLARESAQWAELIKTQKISIQ
ncbi:MAG: ABC transporter substrate-binding protein [Burkholderiales bacterium]|nr:MAG: ABC transporter substrate-binding protein [Burkholderiales bacterium]